MGFIWVYIGLRDSQASIKGYVGFRDITTICRILCLLALSSLMERYLAGCAHTLYDERLRNLGIMTQHEVVLSTTFLISTHVRPCLGLVGEGSLQIVHM